MIRIFGHLTKRQWGQVILAIALIVVQVWLDLSLPDYMANITKLAETPGSTMAEILEQGGSMMLCALGSMVATAMVTYLAAKVASGLGRTLRSKVFDHTLELSKGETERFDAASLVNRCTNDITQIQMLVSMGLNAIVKAPVMAVWAVAKIVGYGWQWSLATGVSAALVAGMLGLTIVFSVPRFARVQGLNDVINRLVREHLQGIRPVHAYNAERYEQERFNLANDEITDNNLVAYRVMAIMNPGMTFVTSTLTLVVYWIGAHLVEASGMVDKLTVYSQMVVFSNYAMQVIMAFILLTMIFILLPRAQVSARRVLEVIDTTNDVVSGGGAEIADRDKGTVEFQDVSFSYPDDGARALSHISFKAARGETVAFIGATGSGKTTLVQLVDRLYDASDGRVLVDGVDIRDFDLDDLRNRIGYVPQTATLFKGTVTSNLSYGDCGHEMSDADVRKAISIAQSTDFVEAMPKGYDATIEQGGRNVSGGQRQRLAIGRAIARHPEILVFDDSFSALDFTTDRMLRHALDRECAGTTRLVVAQRVSTIRHADQIVVLDHGRVAGLGTHEQLMESCPTYQEIVSSQLSAKEMSHA